jgi:RNA polymerase sigma-70 factor (ECF subfamily)
MKDSSKTQSDSLLMARIASGDTAAFQEAFDREASGVLKIAYVYLKDNGLAEDVTQEVFARLWNNAEDWSGEAQIKTWLNRVTRNLAIDYIRKRKSDIKKGDMLLKNQVITAQNFQHPKGEKGLEAIYAKKTVKTALFSLPERQREAVTLVYYMGCSGAEAADNMGLTVSALESLLARARRNLREELTEHKIELMEIVGGVHEA